MPEIDTEDGLLGIVLMVSGSNLHPADGRHRDIVLGRGEPSTEEIMVDAAISASCERGMGEGPAWSDCPVTTTRSANDPNDAADNPTGLPTDSSNGPCSICSSGMRWQVTGADSSPL
ncbi:MAG: hypothetical protein R2848_12005 [Thermomicrobiales bacterium]